MWVVLVVAQFLFLVWSVTWVTTRWGYIHSDSLYANKNSAYETKLCSSWENFVSIMSRSQETGILLNPSFDKLKLVLFVDVSRWAGWWPGLESLKLWWSHQVGRCSALMRDGELRWNDILQTLIKCGTSGISKLIIKYWFSSLLCVELSADLDSSSRQLQHQRCRALRLSTEHRTKIEYSLLSESDRWNLLS